MYGVSTVFQLYRGGQCAYPRFPGVLLTSTPHNILSKSTNCKIYAGSPELILFEGAFSPFFTRIAPLYVDLQALHVTEIHFSSSFVTVFQIRFSGFRQWLCGKAVTGLERILCGVMVKKNSRRGMDRCTGRRDITKILLKTTLNTIKIAFDILLSVFNNHMNSEVVLPVGMQDFAKCKKFRPRSACAVRAG